MLNNKGFDMWADEYDRSVKECLDENAYPFAGYGQTLNTVYSVIHSTKNSGRILDLGFGTAVLTKKLYDDGYEICGMDFSERMIKIAREKMPNALLMQGDMTQSLPEGLSTSKFDFIISTYAIHHLDDGRKIELLNTLYDMLNLGGIILIGDVMTKTRAEMDNIKIQAGDEYDEDEIYMVFDEIAPKLPHARFTKTSFCAGILIVCK